MKKLIIFFILFITGCTRYNDLTNLTIIKSIGIAYHDKYYVYAQIIDHIDDNNKPIMKTIEENGKEINESFNNLKKRINKDTYLSHIDLLVLEDNLKKDNYQSIVNYFISNNDFRNDFYCIFSDDAKLLLEKSDYDEIEMFLKTNESKERTLIKNFDTIIKEFIDSKTITLPRINYQDEIIYLGNIKYNRSEDNYVKKN